MINYLNAIEFNAQKYDERGDPNKNVLIKAFLEARYGWAIARLQKYKVQTVLDFGCGLGYGTYLIYKNGFKVEGYDISKEAIDECRKRYPHIKFLRTNVPMKFEKKYDAIIASEVLEHVMDVELFIETLCENLNRPGLTLLTTPNVKYSKKLNPHHYHEYSLEELRELLPNAKIEGLMSIFMRGLRFWSVLLPEDKAYSLMLLLEKIMQLNRISQYCRYFLIEFKI